MPIFSAPYTPNPIILSLSSLGVTSDAPNGLDYGVTAPTGTGQEAAVQSIIDTYSANAIALGAPGIRVVWDVALALGGSVYLPSNTDVYCPDLGCGAIARSGALCPLLRVRGSELNMGGGAYTGAYIANTQKTFGKFNPAKSALANPQYYRVFDPAYVNANNIRISGGTWNGNQPQQNPRAAGSQSTPVAVTTANIGWVSALDFRGVNGLTLSGCRVFLGREFGIYMVNCGNVLLDNLDVDQISDQNYDNDAIHLNGPCRHVRMINPRVHCADDCIALNADDANFSSSGLPSGVNWACGGDITDVSIENATLWEGRQGVVSWGAICFRSTVSRIDNVIVRGFQGPTANWAIWAPQFGNGMLVAGPGNIGRVVLEDITVDLSSPVNSPAVIGWGLNTERLEIRKRSRTNATAVPDIFIAPGVTIQSLDIDGYSALQTAGAVNNNQPIITNAGTIKSLRANGATYRDDSISPSAAPVLLNTSYAPTTSQKTAFPNSGSGTIDNALLDFDAKGVTNVAQVTAGSIGTLTMRGTHRSAGGGSPLANAGSVRNLIVGAGAFPLAYTATASYTGTAPANINTYSELAATLETPALAVAGATMYIQGTYTGTAPTSGTASLNGGAAAAISNFTAASGYWFGSITAPAAAANTNTLSVTLSGGTTATAPSQFATIASSGSARARAQFIAGTTGFATTLGSYTGSTNGDLGNAWTVSTTGNTTTALQPAIASAGGGLTHGPLVYGAYYHNLTNMGVLPPTSGWKFQISDLMATNATAARTVVALHVYSDAAQSNDFQCTIATAAGGASGTFAFSNVVGGTTTNISGASGTFSFAPFSAPHTWELVNDGTNVTLLCDGASVGSVATSAISSTLTSGSGYTYAGWTALSNISGQTTTISLTSFSFGY